VAEGVVPHSRHLPLLRAPAPAPAAALISWSQPQRPLIVRVVGRPGARCSLPRQRDVGRRSADHVLPSPARCPIWKLPAALTAPAAHLDRVPGIGGIHDHYLPGDASRRADISRPQEVESGAIGWEIPQLARRWLSAHPWVQPAYSVNGRDAG
jgi:hypothetical protein